MNWKQKIEAQIAGLHGHVCAYDSRVRSAGDTMQALLDVAVAAEQHVAEWDDADENLQVALDKLREVGDE